MNIRAGSIVLKNLILKRSQERRLLNGHLWVFSNEVGTPPAGAEPGELVCARASSGRPLGHAIYNPSSLIVARLLGSRPPYLDRSFFKQRIEQALELRSRCFPDEPCYRLVHGESDLLPGLLVDRFADHLVVQTVTVGMEKRLPDITRALEEVCSPVCIIERNDSRLRSYEELEERVGVLAGSPRVPLQVRENGLLYELDLLQGQKTGFFLDQKLNRLAAARYASGASVLDCFCNTGGFGLNALQSGAREVVAVDSSEMATQQTAHNATLNGFQERVRVVRQDVFSFLSESELSFDLIILDPPSFTRNRKQVRQARQAYQRLSQLACRRMAPGGFLVIASCSFHIQEETFFRAVQQGAFKARRSLQLLERHSHSPDHPSLPAMRETSYLKMGIYRVL